MSNENTTASQMQHPELSEKNDVNPDATDTTVEIATLRVRITHLESLNTLLHEQIQRLREQNFALNDEAKELREERDAARRDFCAASYDDPHLVARERGWDCFKEESK